ncbi:hypothetical protein LCGC14_2930730 [marine sediment metagenome]|uniref:Uncharacterized protein n=1 Tax=marine sediment metagenome TaxID=412755 RepID=A0A0F8XLD0_9ZZZZ
MTIAFERAILDVMDRKGLVSKRDLAVATERTLGDIDRALKSLVRKGQAVKHTSASYGQILYERG